MEHEPGSSENLSESTFETTCDSGSDSESDSESTSSNPYKDYIKVQFSGEDVERLWNVVSLSSNGLNYMISYASTYWYNGCRQTTCSPWTGLNLAYPPTLLGSIWEESSTSMYVFNSSSHVQVKLSIDASGKEHRRAFGPKICGGCNSRIRCRLL